MTADNIIPLVRRTPPPIIGPSDDTLVASFGGLRSALNLAAPIVISATLGRFCRAVIIRRGVGGSFVLHDCASIDTASAANTILVVPHGVVAGTVIDLDWPCAVGITLSAVPSGGIRRELFLI